MITYIEGDLTETDCLVIAHGVNCQNVMGSGVARALFEKWPRVKWFYHDHFNEFDPGPNGEKFLGTIDYLQVKRGGKVIANCFTQQYFGPGDKLYLSYDALYKCMVELKRVCLEMYNVNEIAIPKIGCGLAGGDWTIVEAILKSVFPDDFNVKVYVK